MRRTTLALVLVTLQVLLTSTALSHVGGEEALPGIPGRPGSDYPTLWKVPQTSFSCVGRLEGFYADVEARCQVFHVCGLSSGSRPQQSFLCPNGTLFNVEVKTCDWWNNVECGDNPPQEVLQPLTPGEETQYSLNSAKLNTKESLGSDFNSGLYNIHKVENKVKINSNRSKFLLDAFNTKVDTNGSSGNSFSNTSPIIVPEDTYFGLRGVFREGDTPQEVRTEEEVIIQPRVRYTHYPMSSSTKTPILSVTTYLGATESSFVSQESPEQNKYTQYDRTNERHFLQKPLFDGISRDTETEFTLNNKDKDLTNTPDESKYVNKQRQNQYYSKSVTPKVAKASEQNPLVATDDLYLENTKPPQVPESYFVQYTTNETPVNYKLKSYVSEKEEEDTSSIQKLDGGRKETYDGKIKMDEVVDGFRTAFDEDALIRKLFGRVSENGLFPLLVNESQPEVKGKPDDLNSMAERYLNRYLQVKQDQKFLTPLSDGSKEGGNINEIKNKNLTNLEYSTSSSNSSFVFDKFVSNHGTHNSSGGLQHTGLSVDLKIENNKSQHVGDLINKEHELGFSISKQNFTYEKHSESLPEYRKINIQPVLPTSTKDSVSNSYVSVPNFSSFPELYTSSVSGYYITELPTEVKRFDENFMKNYDGKVKNRSTRLDGQRYNTVSTTEMSLETRSDLLISETESVYTTPKITSTLEEIQDKYHNYFNTNLNTPVTEDTSLQATKTILPTENRHETSFENGPFLGPEISFENSHIAWPIFPPRSIFYSPYPGLKHSTSQLGAESLTFFPHPPKRNRVNPTNNNEMQLNPVKDDQVSSPATENYASSTPNYDLSQVLQQFLANSPDRLIKNYSDTQSSTALVQTTSDVYSESTTSAPLHDTILNSEPPSLDGTPLEMIRTNDSPVISTLQTTENSPLFDESSYGEFRKEFINEDSTGINRENSRVPNGPLRIDFMNLENPNPSLTSLPKSTSPQDHSHGLKTILEPPDVLSINNLKTSSESTIEENFKHSEIVKSLSFDLNSPEEREQFEAAQSKGLLKR